jgi:radical SAM protein with 4Fe4S-binding SPASM domain
MRGCLIPVVPAGRAQKDLILNAEETVDMLYRVEKAAERLNCVVSLWCISFAGLVMNSRKVLFDSCRTSEELDISPQGEVLLCDVLDISLANVREGLKTAWRKQEENELNRNLIQPRLSPSYEQCQLRERCLGGCFAQAQLTTGNIYAPAPFCPRVAGIK